MLFAFPSFPEDRSGVSTWGLLFVLTHRGARGGGRRAVAADVGGLRHPGDDDQGAEANDRQDSHA